MYYWWCNTGQHYVTLLIGQADAISNDRPPVCPREDEVLKPSYVIYVDRDVIDGADFSKPHKGTF